MSKENKAAVKITGFCLKTFREDDIDLPDALTILDSVRLFIVQQVSGLGVTDSVIALREFDKFQQRKEKSNRSQKS